jgi:hypothetical protein
LYIKKALSKIKAIKLLVIFGVAVMVSAISVPNVLAFTASETTGLENGTKVDIKTIEEFSKNLSAFGVFGDSRDASPSQTLVNTVVGLYNVAEDEFKHGVDVLRYLFPNDSDNELKSENVTPEQCVQWLNSVGYTADIENKSLHTDEIKKHLDDADPLIVVLKCDNPDYWIESDSAALLYGHDDVDSDESELHESFVKSVNHGDAVILDDNESNSFMFNDMASSPDEIARLSSFKWVKTIDNFKKIEGFDREEHIREDRKNGVFNTTVQKSGNDITSVEFTDSDLISLDQAEEKNIDPFVASAVKLINLYEDDQNQYNVNDLYDYLDLKNGDEVSIGDVQKWYDYLGFYSNFTKGKPTKQITKQANSKGMPYLIDLIADDSKNDVSHTAVIGAGFIDNSLSGYLPTWSYITKLQQINAQYELDMNDLEHAFDKLTQDQINFNYSYINRAEGEYADVDCGKYTASGTLTDIHVKDTVKSITSPFTASKNPTEMLGDGSEATSKLANYISANDFSISETQDQQPWCSAFVNAAAINTINKSENLSGEVKAKDLMQLFQPGLTDEELEKTGAGDVGNSINVIQKNYGVTVDFENSTLNFTQIKKEIDNDQIIQMDCDDLTDPEETGHALAIVGYVSSQDGDTSDKAPFYQVWNPWWQTTFYVSSKSRTMLLGGSEYQWSRTWHNWRADAKALQIGKNSELFKIKTTQDNKVNKPFKKFSFNNQENFHNNFPVSNTFDFSNLNTMNTAKSNEYYDFYHNESFSYSYLQKGDASTNLVLRYKGRSAKTSFESSSARKFVNAVKVLNDATFALEISIGVSVCIICALIAVGPEATVLIRAILDKTGLFGKGLDISSFAAPIGIIINERKTAISSFNTCYG